MTAPAPPSSTFAPGALWPAVVTRSRHALATGALRPIATQQHWIDDGGVRFAIRQSASLARKALDLRPQAPTRKPASDPFRPYDPTLFVASVSSTHVALLNKYNVIDHHLLLVTLRFVDQETLLDHDDFLALAACLGEIDGLAFYNGGQAAGASQAHKHLQLVPLPLTPDGPCVPIEPLLDAVRGACGVGPLPGFAFRQAFAWLELGALNDTAAVAHALLACYRALLDAAGIDGIRRANTLYQSAPYNLLVTRRWMLLVPRIGECFGSLSINALGYAGSLFVKNAEQFDAIRHAGPLAVLRAVAVSSQT